MEGAGRPWEESGKGGKNGGDDGGVRNITTFGGSNADNPRYATCKKGKKVKRYPI